ncbi:zinc finger protein 799-like [Armigeres subalbatus]|uniref:zinc finger protein 799-like n=1 Tax=Armigeres subalbatus TaxID=124917 RepID=UPI002ED0A53E
MASSTGLFQAKSIASICRLCFMERKQLERIFDDDNGQCSEWIEKLTSLKLIDIPNAPACLCLDCKSTLQAFDAFREMCITNDLVFKDAFCRDASNPTDEYASIEIKNECEELGEEYQQTSISIVQTDVALVIGETTPLEQLEENDVLSSELMIDDYEIKIQDIDPNAESDDITIAPTVEDNEEIETIADYSIIENIEIDSSVESDADSTKNGEETKILLAPKAVLADTNKYRCKTCKQYSTKLHELGHKSRDVYYCYICSSQFIDYYRFSEHFYKWHRNVEKSAGQNKDKVQKKANDKPSKTVMASQHNKGNQQQSNNFQYRCEICSKYTSYLHVKIHKSLEVFQCHICPKEFRRMHNCTRHISSHKIKKERTCKVCKKLVLKLHFKTHKAKNVFQCYICKKKYLRIEYISRHMKAHGKKRNAAQEPTIQIDSSESDDDGKRNPKNRNSRKCEIYCPICNKYSSKLHSVTHKAEGKFVCLICEKNFVKFDYVSRHIKAHEVKSKKTVHSNKTAEKMLLSLAASDVGKEIEEPNVHIDSSVEDDE